MLDVVPCSSPFRVFWSIALPFHNLREAAETGSYDRGIYNIATKDLSITSTST